MTGCSSLPYLHDNIKGMWNSHSTRNSINAECTGGRPGVLYFNPAVAGATNYKFPLAGEKIDQALRFSVHSFFVNCARELFVTSIIKND